jgi:hypothetical protein
MEKQNGLPGPQKCEEEMPQVNPTEITSEESKQQLEAQETLHKNVLDKIKGGNVVNEVFKSLELPEDKQGEVEKKVEEEPEVQDEAQEEPTQGEDVEEEVIPKSKIQPRIDSLTAKIKLLEQRLAEKETAAAPVDDTQRKLDGMSEGELEDTLTQVRVAKEKARDDDNKLLELVRLERQIEKTIVQAPQRFVQNQVREFNRAAERLSAEGDITEANSPKILEIAKEIYGRYPKLSKQLDGQAMALELAVSHFKELNKTSTTKTEAQNLKAQVNTLKKKTMLDTKSIKAGGEKVALDKLRSNALTGTLRDKEKFAQNDPRFKIDQMIPDFLKG